jgi:hypothetical protein
MLCCRVPTRRAGRIVAHLQRPSRGSRSAGFDEAELEPASAFAEANERVVARFMTYGLPGRVHVSAATRKALGNAFRFEPRGSIDVKGKGPMETYFPRSEGFTPCPVASGANKHSITQ